MHFLKLKYIQFYTICCREQERRRYDNPHKAFTYRCNNYESVVGPLKGIYNPSVGNTKARGHTMLSADRPNFVTILSLVRDAAARLPNGEGTRAEICELLKSSQYISSTAPDNLLQSVVSGALDRMHTQWDPCVKYDQKRKIWIYLHRNRTEEDFERIHQQYQGNELLISQSNICSNQMIISFSKKQLNFFPCITFSVQYRFLSIPGWFCFFPFFFSKVRLLAWV